MQIHNGNGAADTVLLRPAQALRVTAGRLHAGALAHDQVESHYRRLAALFDVEFACFERKTFVNLSHEPNKAMNLNSYLGLVGGRFVSVPGAEGTLCLAAGPDDRASWSVPDADYVLTLDADSLVTHDYMARLVHLMEQSENRDVAIAQTPYSAIPGSTDAVERVAGATTDIQYLIHQGFTRFNATFWVGANALLRRRALQEIARPTQERGFAVWRYIHDRTVIEDTESTVDLIDRGWRLVNYPERLSFSATPPDFGALLIQRRRWANGGLIILPKLFRYLGRRRLGPNVLEAAMRAHYLGSIAAVNLGLVLLLTLPLGSTMWTWILPCVALPYFLLYWRDLKLLGYRSWHLVEVYALNLLLIPVNLGGVLKSMEQAVTGRKIPFGRTPKVQGRTAVPLGYLLAEYALLVAWSIGGAFTLSQGKLLLGSFAASNALLLGYAIVRFVGVRSTVGDFAAGANSLPRWPSRAVRFARGSRIASE